MYMQYFYLQILILFFRKADIAEKKKVEGNKLYVDKKYGMALQLYTEAIGELSQLECISHCT